MATNSFGNAILLASISITDTSVHTYKTNPFKNGAGIFLLSGTHRREPQPYTVSIPIQNTADQELTVTVIGNIDPTQTFSDYSIGSGSVSANGQDILYIYMKGANAFPSEFISINLSYATAPTSGSVLAYVLFYGE